MASANLELVRSIYAAWERRDFSSAEWAQPEIEYAFVGGPEPGSRTGLAEMAKGERVFLSAWEEFRVAPEDYRELDDERVLVLTRSGGRGKRSGLEIGQISRKSANLFQLSDGKVTRLIAYWDRDRALADLGLTPEDAP